MKQHVVDLQLQPLNIVLRKTLDLLQTKDPGEIFAEPVDTDEVGKGNKWLAVACLHRILFLVETSDSWKFVCLFQPFLRANKLKATEGKIASGYPGK